MRCEHPSEEEETGCHVCAAAAADAAGPDASEVRPDSSAVRVTSPPSPVGSRLRTEAAWVAKGEAGCG